MITLFIHILTDVFRLKLRQLFLRRLADIERWSGSLIYCKWVEDLLAPVKFDVIIALDILRHVVNANLMAREVEEVRLLPNVLLERLLLLG